MICPCCGQTIAEKSSVEFLADAKMSVTQKLILEVLVKAYPRKVRREAIFYHVWGNDPNGGPEQPYTNLAVHLGRMRPVLAMHGWTVPKNKSGAGNIGSFKLEPLA
jgi:DNA-binding response OmpR family regulator